MEDPVGHKKQKKIDEALKSGRMPRRFHPAAALMQKADGELTVLMAAATVHDIALTEHRGEGGSYLSFAPRIAREPRRIGVYARFVTEDNKTFDMRIGMKLVFYDPSQLHREMCEVDLWRMLSKQDWHLDLLMLNGRRKVDERDQPSVRRLGLLDTRQRVLGSKDLLDMAFAMAKDYKEQVLIPREVREKARKK